MSRVCGPILGFRGEQGGRWRVSIMVVHKGGTTPGALSHALRGQAPAPAVQPTRLGDAGGAAFFAYEIEIAMQASEQMIEYRLDGDDTRWAFATPGSAQPLRISYASCNGFSLPGDMKKIGDKSAVWRDLVAQHKAQPFHILLMGGDQIYADQLWEVIPELRGFNELPVSERVTRTASRSLRNELERFYVETYRDRFSQGPVAAAFASIPTVMMWDDHDIFDGWGSYSDAEQASPVFRTIFDAARTCFILFQLQTNPLSPAWPALPGQASFNALLRIGSIGLLVLDLRSERLQRQVVAPATWNTVLDALDRTDGLRHLLIMSSIPVVHPDMAFIERTLEFVPGQLGEQGNEDDLHDHWASYNHKTEKLRFLHRLFDFADAKGTRVTILSGDVHVAALGVVESVRRPVRYLNANDITQLTSSPIVHPTPPRIVRYLLEQLGRDAKEIDRDIRAQMLQFPGTNFRILSARNWLSLEFDNRERIWANWHIEGQTQVLTKVVHPCERVTTTLV